MAASTTKTFTAQGDRYVKDTYTDSNAPTVSNERAFSLSIGTSGFGRTEAYFQFDLTGIPKNVIISTAILTLNVLIAASAGTAAELAIELIRLPAGFDYDFEQLDFNTYDGINDWPTEQFDRELRLIDAMQTSTGSWTLVDLKVLIDYAIQNNERYLHLVIRRVQQTASHRAITVDSSNQFTTADRPKLVISHSVTDRPDTVIIGGRRRAKVELPQRVRTERQTGVYFIEGDNLYLSQDGTARIISTDGTKISFLQGSLEQCKIISTGLDGLGTKRLTNWSGMRSIFTYGWPNTNTAIARNLQSAGQANHGGNDGYVMPRAGSIVSVTGHLDLNAIVSANIDMRVNKNGTYPGANAVLVTPIVANGHKWFQTFAVGTHTFVAGDLLGGTRFIDGTSATTDDMNMVMEVEWD